MPDDEIAAGRHGAHVPVDNRGCQAVIGDEVQDGVEDNGDWAGKVDDRPDAGTGADSRWVPPRALRLAAARPSSEMKCRTALRITATGREKSMTARMPELAQTAAGSRRSPWMPMTPWLLRRIRCECATATGSMST